jgi:hypothetical protein
MPVWDPKANDLLSQALTARVRRTELFLDQACARHGDARSRGENVGGPGRSRPFLNRRRRTPRDDRSPVSAERPAR